ncbi:fasciclin domain-containing protein [Salipiger bermudensis]|uniref:Beta-Ig-H3/Fasciclin n=1 Tax=Salipiger bermudensis (strain DSM 26914 / JCM 13377 / KCTC 12554 / HTCC2601) TaxID=314265 RepID=Q0FSX7_SALBH|nr:Beta-Ig-H3/Fasciclin [Salipiger bermudensis HTCC2601]
MKMFFATAATAAVLASPVLADHHMETIPAVAEEAGDFTTLLAAVEAAGLAETLSGEGPFTVLAPTDAAFEALPEGTLDELLMPENKDQLVDILTYHVIEGAVMSGDLDDGMTATTIEGGEVTFDLSSEPMVNDATIVMPDVEASNGVIHAIDTVLMPEG